MTDVGSFTGPRITVRPVSAAPPGSEPDPSDYLTSEPIPAPAVLLAAPAAAEAHPSEYLNSEPVAPKELPQVTQPEAATQAAEAGFTQRFGPAIHGIEAAGYETMPDWAKNLFGPDRALFAERAPAHLAKMITGLGRLGYEHLIAPALGIPAEQYGTQAYEQTRQAAEERRQAAEVQWPKTYLGTEIGTTLAGPKFGMLKGANPWSRVGWSTLGGGAAGATTEAGQEISKGEPAGTVATQAAKGAGAGAVLGLGGGALLEGGRKVYQVGRGLLDPTREAAIRSAETMLQDVERRGTAITPEEAQAAQIAGTPLTVMDWGHEATRRLARWASNLSTDAANEFGQMIIPRFQAQAERISGFLDRMFGGLDRGAEREGIEQSARNANAPAYRRAYAVGQGDLTTQRIQDLAQTNEVQEAMRAAEKKWRSSALLDGFGGNFPTEKNLQYWDYVHRELAQRAKAAARNGLDDDARRYSGLDNTLKNELDGLVPEFARARAGAYGYFQSENALDAGAHFLMHNSVEEMQNADRALSQMSQPDRELFARGFASELISKLREPSVDLNVLNKAFVNSPNSQAAIRLALGPTRARQVEALLRVERIADAARRAMGNSTTMQQFVDAASRSKAGGLIGHAGAGVGAAAAFDLIGEGHLDPTHIIMGGLMLAGASGVRTGLHKIDEKTAAKVAELLTSQDPGELSRGLQIVSSSRPLFQALRFLTGGGERVAEREAGPENILAGAATAFQRAIAGHPGEPEHGAHRQDQQQDVISEHLPQ